MILATPTRTARLAAVAETTVPMRTMSAGANIGSLPSGLAASVAVSSFASY